MKKIVIIILSIFFVVSCSNTDIDEISKWSKITLKRDWNKIQITDRANCNLKLYTVASEDTNNDNWIMIEKWKQENSLNINFYDLNTKKPYLVSNLGTSYLWVIDNWDVTYLIEETAMWYIVLYTLFKDKWLLIMSKQYSLFWYAYWTQMIWYCN